jgi:hypothetical protein
MTSGRTNPYVPRFWCPPDGTYFLDADGYVADPEAVGYQAAERTQIYTTTDLTARRCLVLLGGPGAGKTSTIAAHAPLLPSAAREMPVVTSDLGLYGSEERIVTHLLESEEVERWRDSSGELCLVLDAFDEAQTRIPNLARLFRHYISQWPTDRLYLRITCRAAQWPQTLADELTEAFPDPGTFELLPLRRRDVAAFLPDDVDDAVFLNAVRRAHAEPLAVWPLTLQVNIQPMHAR